MRNIEVALDTETLDSVKILICLSLTVVWLAKQ